MENNQPEVKLNENPEGTVSFATDVVATIAGLAANEVEGVASMTSSSSTFADILSRKSSRNYTKGVKVDIDNNRVAVDVTIIVDYGSPVPDVAKNIQENVKKAIETISGLDVLSVDVHVQGVSFEKENQAAELSETQKKLLENSAQPVTEEATDASDNAVNETEDDGELEYEMELPEVDEDGDEA